MFDPHIYAASRIIRVLRGSPWYDVPAEALDILLNIFQHEGAAIEIFYRGSLEPPEFVRKVIMDRTADHGDVSARVALFKIRLDTAGKECVHLTTRGKQWKREVIASILQAPPSAAPRRSRPLSEG